MNPRSGILPGLLSGLLLSMASAGTAAPSPKPNIIVIFTDDHGYADLSCQGIEKDVKTPNLDRMAAEGVRFTDGYVTSPQCCPSRAGLLTGRDQNRFGFLSNGHGPLPMTETTIADRLGAAGYVTGMVGKWHLEPNHSDKAFLDKHQIKDGKIPPALAGQYHPHARGFQETFFGYINSYSATYDLAGNRFKAPKRLTTEGDRLDRQSDAAVQFIDIHHDKPFFLYLAYYGPHVPMASSPKYLDRFPGKMPERRRYALAMLSAIDDGVGRILQKLDGHGIDENTLVFFIGDNGAPLKLTMEDAPIKLDGAYWNGSRNTPLTGEKGMLAEGGIRVPYLMRWKGAIPAGQVVKTPVSTLDVAATAMAVARSANPAQFDGENLLPLLTKAAPLAERALCWRFWGQSAIRIGDWKLLKFADKRTFLFNVASDPAEKNDLLGQQPDVAARLENKLADWAARLTPPGLPDQSHNPQEAAFFHHFFQVPQN